MEDGINDTPTLKKVAVGIAMETIGSDIAVEAVDIALVDDEIKELPYLLTLTKRMMVTIKCNLTFFMALNFIAIILAITGILNPVVDALVHNVGSVLVIVNSVFLLKWRRKIVFSIVTFLNGILIFTAGIYYLIKERKDKESKKYMGLPRQSVLSSWWII